MIPASIIKSFNDKCVYLVNAILEDKLGRVPGQKELEDHLRIVYDNNSGTRTFFWDKQKLFAALLKEAGDGVGIAGDFDIPEELANNQYIKERLEKWKS